MSVCPNCDSQLDGFLVCPKCDPPAMTGPSKEAMEAARKGLETISHDDGYLRGDAQKQLATLLDSFARRARLTGQDVRRLFLALEEIRQVASGETQVANDDTEGMAWIDKRAQEELAKPLAARTVPNCQQQSSGPSGNAQDSVTSDSAVLKTATKCAPTEDVDPKRTYEQEIVCPKCQYTWDHVPDLSGYVTIEHACNLLAEVRLKTARTGPDDSPSTFSHDWNVGYNDGCRDAAENIKRNLEGLLTKWANRNCLCSEELESELARVRQRNEPGCADLPSPEIRAGKSLPGSRSDNT